MNITKIHKEPSFQKLFATKDVQNTKNFKNAKEFLKEQACDANLYISKKQNKFLGIKYNEFNIKVVCNDALIPEKQKPYAQIKTKNLNSKSIKLILENTISDVKEKSEKIAFKIINNNPKLKEQYKKEYENLIKIFENLNPYK